MQLVECFIQSIIHFHSVLITVHYFLYLKKLQFCLIEANHYKRKIFSPVNRQKILAFYCQVLQCLSQVSSKDLLVTPHTKHST